MLVKQYIQNKYTYLGNKGAKWQSPSNFQIFNIRVIYTKYTTILIIETFVLMKTIHKNLHSKIIQITINTTLYYVTYVHQMLVSHIYNIKYKIREQGGKCHLPSDCQNFHIVKKDK